MFCVYFILSFREIFWHQIHVSPDSISTGKAVQSGWKTPKMWTPHRIPCFRRLVCLAKLHPWGYYQITPWIACKRLSQRWRFAAQNLISDGCPWTFMCGYTDNNALELPFSKMNSPWASVGCLFHGRFEPLAYRPIICRWEVLSIGVIGVMELMEVYGTVKQVNWVRCESHLPSVWRCSLRGFQHQSNMLLYRNLIFGSFCVKIPFALIVSHLDFGVLYWVFIALLLLSFSVVQIKCV